MKATPVLGIAIFAAFFSGAGLAVAEPTFLDGSFRPELPQGVDGFRALAQPDGKVLVGGLSNGVPVLIRLNADGSMDGSFQFDQQLIPTNVRRNSGNSLDSLVLQPDGKILLAETLPTATEFTGRLVRLNPDGSRDGGFSSGILSGQWARFNIEVLRDGRIFVAGDPGGQTFDILGRMYLYNYAFLLRTNGALEKVLERPLVQNPLDGQAFVSSAAVRQDGRILVAGQFSAPGTNLIQFNPNWSVDRSFKPQLPVGDGDYVSAMTLQSDDRILVSLVTDVHDAFNGGKIRLIRLLPDGQVDASFTPAAQTSEYPLIASFLVLADDSFFVSTAYGTYNAYAQPRSWALHLKRDGTLDFDANATAESLGNVLSSVAPYDAARAVGLVSPPATVDPLTLWWRTPPTQLGRFFMRGSAQPGVGFAASSYVAQEGGPAAILTIKRTGDLSRPASVRYATEDGTARAGADYPVTSGILQFAADQETGAVEVPVLDDALVEVDETLVLKLSDPSPGLVMAGPDRAVLMIRDNESPVSVDPRFKAFSEGVDTSEAMNASVDLVLIQPDRKIVVARRIHSPSGETVLLERLNSDGTVDTGFHSPEITFTGPEVPQLRVLARQSDGKILAGGSFKQIDGADRPGMVRLNPDGSLDRSFTPALSVVGTIPSLAALAVQSDGRILVGGTVSTVDGRHKSIARLDADGSVDDSFQAQLLNWEGKPGFVSQILIQSDGRILVGGYFVSANGHRLEPPVRLNSDGSFDDSFVPDYTFGAQMVLQPDGKLLTFNCLQRFNSDGRLDPGFKFPCAEFESIWTVKPLPDGRAIAAATEPDGATVVLLVGADGQVQQTAKLDLDEGGTVLAEDNGDIWIGGGFSQVDGVRRPGLVKLLPIGNAAQAVQWSTPSLHVSEDAGTALLTLSRNGDSAQPLSVGYAVSGELPSSGSTGTLTFAPLEVARTLAIPIAHDPLVNSNRQSTFVLTNPPPGVLLGAGPAALQLTVHDSERPGSLDFTFRPPPGLRYAGSVRAAALQDDGEILATGVFATADGKGLTSLERLHSDGSRDETFEAVIIPDTEWSASATVYVVEPERDGKMMVGGKFTAVNGQQRIGIARLEGNGHLDESFDPGAAVGPVNALAVQPDGRVLVAGAPSPPDGIVRIILARLELNGRIDPTFTLPAEIQQVTAVVLQPDQKILTAAKVNEQFQLLRLQSSGTLDTTFHASPIGDGPWAITLQLDGRILALHTNRMTIVRLNPDGSLDPSFSGEASVGTIQALALQHDARILVAGDFVTPGGLFIRRLNPDGSLDSSFDAGAREDLAWINDLVIQRDGRVVVAGGFSTFESIPRHNLARLHGDPELRLLSLNAPDKPAWAWVTLPGRQYTLESSTDLRQWAPIQANTAAGWSLRYEFRQLQPAWNAFFRVQRRVP